ncbi:MAG: hypothetical protein HY927_00815 [Elusimicrobia bacterium]|nr:hypothetical protein [Elusimicrobiota bacterium]
MGKLKDMMATRCEHCPLCIHAREHPATWFGRLMEWHGTWCPFWKAWKESYGKRSDGPSSPA